MKDLGLAVASLLWTTAVSAQPLWKSYDVVLDVVTVAGSQELQITSPPQGWGMGDPGNANGYVGFQELERGTIRLTLEVPPSKATCDDYPDPQKPNAWFISKVELSDDGDEATQKGSGFGTIQPGWLWHDFPEANQYGLINPGGERTALTILNMNNFTGNERWIFYRVTVTNCDDQTKTLTTDPGWKNGGK